jgi:hypothetical protein
MGSRQTAAIEILRAIAFFWRGERKLGGRVGAKMLQPAAEPPPPTESIYSISVARWRLHQHPSATCAQASEPPPRGMVEVHSNLVGARVTRKTGRIFKIMRTEVVRAGFNLTPESPFPPGDTNKLCNSKHLVASTFSADYTIFPMRTLPRRATAPCTSNRHGASALDYVLILAAMLPIVLFIVIKGKRVMQLVWEMLCVLVSWPLM